jgi:hypothetical protein
MSAADRSRAYRLRSRVRAGEELEPADAEWLANYESARNTGMSASRRVVSLDIDEQSVSAGTGAAAAEAASAGAIAREEGRRLDYLSRVGIEAMSRACQLYERMASSLLERTKALEEVHLAMLDAVREQYLARTQAEIDAMHAEAEASRENDDEKPDAATSLLEKIIDGASRDLAEKPKESARKPSK